METELWQGLEAWHWIAGVVLVLVAMVALALTIRNVVEAFRRRDDAGGTGAAP